MRYMSVVLPKLEMAQRQTRWRSLRGGVGLEVLGGVVAAHEAVGVEVDGFGLLNLSSIEIDIDRSAHSGGVKAQGDGLADKGGVDLVDEPEEAHGSVLLDLSDLLEEEEFLDNGAVGEKDVIRRHGPSVEGRNTVETPMGSLVVLGFDPAPELAVESFEALGVVLVESR